MEIKEVFLSAKNITSNITYLKITSILLNFNIYMYIFILLLFYREKILNPQDNNLKND